MDKQRRMRAISIRQPHAEMILRGKKKEEFRSRPTKIRERVYIYAASTPAEERVFRKAGIVSDDVPRGVIVGTVEITGCKWDSRRELYAYSLADPRRLARPKRPENHPQPIWFYPFD